MTVSRKYLTLLTAALFVTAVMAGCNKPADEPAPAELEDLTATAETVPAPQDMIFEGNPTFVLHVTNPNAVAVDAAVKVRVYTDKRKEAVTIEQTENVPKKGKDISVTLPKTLEPGFYTAYCYLDGSILTNFVFGVSPASLVSAPDHQADFNAFWDAAVTQLEGIDMKAELTPLPARSTTARNAYLVEIRSVPDGLSGDSVTVRGYYLEPTDGQKHPVIMHFYGYDDLHPKYSVTCPSGGTSGEFAEFYLSHRGQYINNRPASLRNPDDGKGDLTNPYGDWFAFQFGNRDGYYYRGAFLDCVQAIRFMATRPTSDMDNVFAEGSSQGGALSYAAAALSPYPLRAIAPCVAFLGDYPDYFSIVTWPGNVAKANKGSMTDEQMYAFLSYFDTKNLATRITGTAVIACSGLKDETCPPHTNTAPFNNLPVSDKVMYYYPRLKHEIPSDWSGKYMKFFRERIK